MLQSHIVVVEESVRNFRNSSVGQHIIAELGFSRGFGTVALVSFCPLCCARRARESIFLRAHVQTTSLSSQAQLVVVLPVARHGVIQQIKPAMDKSGIKLLSLA